MIPDAGRNAGITGVLDVVGSPQLAVRVYEWKDNTGIQSVDNTGYGSNGQTTSRAEQETGNIMLRGKVLKSKYPVPNVLRNTIGTLNITFDYSTPCNKIQSVRITGDSFSTDQKDQNVWDVTINCVRVGEATWTGWPGANPRQNAPTAGKSAIYAGASKVNDQNRLVDSSTRVIDFWGLTQDDDAGENAKIAAMILAFATAPQTGQKLYTSTLSRTGSFGGRITQIWRPNDSVDDVQYPASPRLVDPGQLADYAASATVVSGSMPAYLASLVNRGKEYRQLTPDRFVEVDRLGTRTTTQDETFPRSPRNIDPNHLQDSLASATVNTGTVPAFTSGMYLRGTESVQLTNNKFVSVEKYGTRSTAHDITLPSTSSWRSAQTAYRDAVAALISSTSSDITVANSLWASFQSVANAYGLTVRSIDPKTKVVVYEYVNPGIQLSGFTGGGGRYVDARVSGGNVQLYVLRNDEYANGQRRVRFGRQWIIDKPIRRFVISRLLSGTTIPEYASQIGQSNNASFLGLSTGTVLYEGPTYQTNISLSGTLPFGMGYSFFQDSNGLFTAVPDQLFLYDQYLTTADTTVDDWVNASTIGVTGISQPTQSDFSAFVS